jgi:hypothetical protein
MTISEIAETNLLGAARRTYELGRLQGALQRGVLAALFALPGYLICNRTPTAALCLAGFAIAVAAGRMRGLAYEEGSKAGAIAGVVPCLIPALIRSLDPNLCDAAMSHGIPWPCALGGLGAGILLAVRLRQPTGLRFWACAFATLAFAAALGCLPAGAMGFVALVAGFLTAGIPALVARRAAG